MAKNPAAVQLGRKGGLASRRLSRLSPEERRRISLLGVAARRAKKALNIADDSANIPTSGNPADPPLDTTIAVWFNTLITGNAAGKEGNTDDNHRLH